MRHRAQVRIVEGLHARTDAVHECRAGDIGVQAMADDGGLWVAACSATVAAAS